MTFLTSKFFGDLQEFEFVLTNGDVISGGYYLSDCGNYKVYWSHNYDHLHNKKGKLYWSKINVAKKMWDDILAKSPKKKLENL